MAIDWTAYWELDAAKRREFLVKNGGHIPVSELAELPDDENIIAVWGEDGANPAINTGKDPPTVSDEIIRRFDSPVLKRVASAIRELECRRGLSPEERRFVETIEMVSQFDTVSLAAIAAVHKI